MNLQQVDGRYQDVMTLPAGMTLSDDQRDAIQKHLASLGSLLLQTPARNSESKKSTFAAITKLFLVKPAAKTSEGAAEARGEVYMDVLEDIPHWAVSSAIRKWHRGDCGLDERGKPYDYRWAPEPHTLRKLASAEAFFVKRQIADLEPLLVALPFEDTTAHLERGRAAYRGIQAGIAGRADLRTMTYDDAVAIDSQMPDTESESSAVKRETHESEGEAA